MTKSSSLQKCHSIPCCQNDSYSPSGNLLDTDRCLNSSWLAIASAWQKHLEQLNQFSSYLRFRNLWAFTSPLWRKSFPGVWLGRPLLRSLLSLPHDGDLHKDFCSWDKGQDPNWALFYLRMTLPSPSWFSGYLDWFELFWTLIWAIGNIYVDPIKLQGGIYFIYVICWSKTFQVTANSIFCIILLESWSTVHF